MALVSSWAAQLYAQKTHMIHEKKKNSRRRSIAIWIHGTGGIFTYMKKVDFYGFHVGKYSSPMDPVGLNPGCFIGILVTSQGKFSNNGGSRIHQNT